MTWMRRVGTLLSALTLAVGAAVALPAAASAPDAPSPSASSSAPAVPSPEATAPEVTREKDVAPNLLAGLRAGLEDLRGKVRAEAGLLSRSVPERASGELVTVPVQTDLEQEDTAGPVRTVRVQVEKGLPVDGEAFAEFVMRTLTDERGWGHDGSVTLVPAEGEDGGPAEWAHITVALASPSLVDELCVPLRTNGQYSCGRNGYAAINAVRWAQGADPFLDAGGSLPQYRQYVVNHEVGHLLGRQHTGCPQPGGPAPVMLQQTMRMEGCTPNGWPVNDPA